MKLRRFRSEWNGMTSKKAYNPRPTIAQIKEAQLNGKAYSGNCVIFSKGFVVEVRTRVDNMLANNVYKDYYSLR